MATMPPIPDLVKVSKLDTQFSSDPEYTCHIREVSENILERRKVRKEERWKKQRHLGRGSFGDVWLEECIHGNSKGEVRAVKKVQKLDRNNYYRELEAIALFSHSNYDQCFVKSLGWYDDENTIYIAMEFLSNGDLHKYLGSPFPENECQNIVFQTLEGLKFMHQNGFAHRDLKPANILVVVKGPRWWVKIADFGISKRATENLTALRTQTGTPAFAAPEVFGTIESDSYTNAVDIWSLGAIAFLILTGEILFKNQYLLFQYVRGDIEFPIDTLLANKVSEEGCIFVKDLMAPKSKDRPGAGESLRNPWLAGILEPVGLEAQRMMATFGTVETPENQSFYTEAEASARWSTHDQSLSFPSYRSMDTLVKKTDLETLITTNPQTKFSSRNKERIAAPRTEIMQPQTEARTQYYTKLPARLKGHSGVVRAVAFSPDGKQIASASEDETVRLWDSATGAARAILNGHSNIVGAVAFSPDGKQIASASNDHTVRLWDSATGAAGAILNGHFSIVGAVAFSPDGKQIASASYNGTVRLWDSATGAARAILNGHSSIVWAVAFSPDGKQIASASDDETVRLWGSATGAAGAILNGHSSTVWAVAFSPDGKQIASASSDQTVRLWDSAAGATRAILKGHSSTVWAVAFSPDGKQIASASSDKTVRLCSRSRLPAGATLKGHSSMVRVVAFSPDGKQIASASNDETVRLWDSATGAARAILKGHSGVVRAVAFSPDGKQIASASDDGTVRLWDSATGTRDSETVKDGTFAKYLKKILK